MCATFWRENRIECGDEEKTIIILISAAVLACITSQSIGLSQSDEVLPPEKFEGVFQVTLLDARNGSPDALLPLTPKVLLSLLC